MFATHGFVILSGTFPPVTVWAEASSFGTVGVGRACRARQGLGIASRKQAHTDRKQLLVAHCLEDAVVLGGVKQLVVDAVVLVLVRGDVRLAGAFAEHIRQGRQKSAGEQIAHKYHLAHK